MQWARDVRKVRAVGVWRGPTYRESAMVIGGGVVGLIVLILIILFLTGNL
jgi:hypothetical protein